MTGMGSYGTISVDVLEDTYLPPIERTGISVDKACGNAGIDILGFGELSAMRFQICSKDGASVG